MRRETLTGFMGAEVDCEAEWNGTRAVGKAHLDSDHLRFTGGDLRVKLLFVDLRKPHVQDDALVLGTSQGTLILHLGTRAQKWLDKILHPPTRLDKLGAKSGMRIAVVGITDDTLLSELTSAGCDVSANPRQDSDIVFVQVDSPAEFTRIAKSVAFMASAGCLWVVTPRGVPEVKDIIVMTHGHKAGLVDVKVARFNDTHTALKFVVPKAQRK